MFDPIDEILKAALENPTLENRQAAVDAEIDNHGLWVGHAMAQYVWDKYEPLAA